MPNLPQILSDALDRPESDRPAFLDGACSNDASLRAEVELLIEAHENADSFLANPLVTGPVVDATVRTTLSEGPGTVIDKYKLLQLIGEGGFGAVYLAEQREPVKRRIALKIIKLGMDTKQVIARFEAERQALAMMDHPHIAKVLDAGATKTGRPYFVMELVKGVPITDYCDTENLDTKGRLDLFINVCKAVQHAHQKGIIHRDLKPSNVMVTLHDGKPVPKVIDFGIAKATNRELTDKTLFTEYRQFLGTPEYMSPEQAEMSGLDIDTRSDIYSLGVLLYELLTGVTPFDGKRLRSAAINEIQRIIREEEPSKPSTRLSELSHVSPSLKGGGQKVGGASGRTDAESQQSSIQYIAKHRRSNPSSLSKQLRGDLDWIIMKAMEKDRSRRYETANGFSADIQRYLTDEPVTATPPSASYKLKKLIRRNKSAFAAAAVVFLVLTLGITGTTWGMISASRANDELYSANTKLDVSLIDANAQRERAEESEATAIAQTERAERELARANEVKQLIIDMFRRIKPKHAQGADITLLKSILDDTAERLANGEIEDELIAAELHGVIGNTYRSLALYEGAERHLPVALETFRRLLGEDDLGTLWAKTELAILHAKRARYSESERIFADILDRYERLQGEEDPLTLMAMNNLASSYRDQGKYDEAERMLLALREIQRRVPGSDPTLGAKVLGNLYIALSRYAEAESVLLELIEHMREHGLAEHPQTIGAMQNLAITYSHRRRYAEAAAIYKDALELAQRILGPKHSTTIHIIANLGYVRLNQGHLEESEALLTEALRLYREVLGEKNPFTLTFVATLADLRAKQGRDADAEALYRQAIKLMKEVLGERHKDTLGPMTNFGYFLLRRSRYDEAREIFETTLPIKREVLGNNHLFTRAAMRGLANTYVALDRRADALPLKRELLDLSIAPVDELDADAGTLNNAAWDLLTHDFEELHDPDRALRLAKRACSKEEADSGANLWVYLDTLALAEHMTGDTAQAIETQHRAISLIPNGADKGTIEELETNLRTYAAALAEQDDGD